MRVLLLGPYPPPYGGVQTHLIALRRYLADHQIPSELINLTRYRRPNADGIYYPRTPQRLAQLLLSLRYDIAHLHAGGHLSWRVLSVALACASIPRRRTVFTFHSGGYPSSPAGKNAHRFTCQAFVLRRFDRLIAVNGELRDFYHGCGAPLSRIRLISPYAPVHIPEGTALPKEMEAFYGQHDPVLLNVAGLEPEYDLPRQVQAFHLLRKSFPRAGLVIIGSGSLENELRSLIARLPEREHIMLCGDVPHASTLLAMRRCSVLLRTTLYDGDAMSVREGLQLGTPVIATDNGMRPAGVVLIAPANLDALRAATENLLRGGAPRSKPVIADDRNLSAIVDLYRELLPESAAESVAV
ncbi:MAG: glycosyltransferase family 4 protein [Terriglobia bacterium]